MTVTQDQITAAKRYLVNVDEAAAVANVVKIPFFLLCAVLDKESDGYNVFGHDSGGAMYGEGEVTEEKYRLFKSLIDSGMTSNGVGPMQITYKPFFAMMEERGLKPWVPYDNILFGAELVNDYYVESRKTLSETEAIRKTGRLYNGAWPYGDSLVTVAQTWKERLTVADVQVKLADPKRPAAGSKTVRTALDSETVSTRTAAMIKEARRLYKLRGHGSHPSLTQGGYNAGGVEASAGTHDKDAFDDKLRILTSRAKKLAWELCLWEVGFAYWRRDAITGLWVEHGHGLPKGGELSSAAKGQITQWNQGDNALKSDKDYPRILSSGLVDRTWEQYRDKYYGGANIDLSGVVAAFKSGKALPDGPEDNDVHQIQRALNHFLDRDLAVDGIPGPVTKDAYATYQARQYGIAKGSADANGIPGIDSLARLGFTVWE